MELDSHATDVVFPRLERMTQLVSLKIEADAESLSFRSSALSDSLGSCPNSLRSLAIQRLGPTGNDRLLIIQLEQCLLHITKLELRNCCTSFFGGFPGEVGITALTCLHNLSFHGSMIKGNQSSIVALTQLTSLDLTDYVGVMMWNIYNGMSVIVLQLLGHFLGGPHCKFSASVTAICSMNTRFLM